MINTITLNPSLDYIVKVDDFKAGHVNRTSEENIYPGGKGINVSIVLKNLGVKNRALGFVAGFTGEEIEKLVADHGVDSDFIKLEKGMSRINVKLKSKEESEINGMGPNISQVDIEKLYKAHISCKNYGDIRLINPSELPKMDLFTYSYHWNNRCNCSK